MSSLIALCNSADLVDGGRFGLGRVLDDVSADADQVAAQRQIIDDASVVGRIGRRRRAVHKVGEIAQAAELLACRCA